jgi:hypothetical protein
MKSPALFLCSVFAALGMVASCAAAAPPDKPLPDPHQLMQDVFAHQKQLDKIRETYTYTMQMTTQDLNGDGAVTKTELEEFEVFFVNRHEIARLIKKDGKPLDAHDEEKESARVSKLVEKAEKAPSGQSINSGENISISRVLAIMDVSAARREQFRGRPTIVFDFAGRKDAKAHGLAEEASKKLKGTIWIDEADREVAHLEVTFYDNFHVGGGLVANVQKGSNFRFDQAPVDGGLWLPTGAEGTMKARVLLLKNMRQHFTVRNSDYKRFSVDAQQIKDAKTVTGKP